MHSEKEAFLALGMNYHFGPNLPEAYASQSKGSLILITNTHCRLSSFKQEIHARIKLILHPNSGYDNFSPVEIKALKAPIVIAPKLRSDAVAEACLIAFLSAQQPTYARQSWPKIRQWKRKLLSDQKALIIGFGFVGKKLKQSLTSLGLKVKVYDPFKGYTPLPKDFSFDAIFLCAGLNPTSYHLVDQKFLSLLPEETIIINCARGELIDEDALKMHLKNNPLTRCYLDVFETEPWPKKNPFLYFPNVKTSAHIAGIYDKLNESSLNWEIEVARDFLKLSKDEFRKKYDSTILKHRLIQHEQGLFCL